MATKANQHSLNDQLEITRQRFNHLYQCFRTSPTEQALLPEALEEFSNSLEELAASAEELSSQNDEVAATRALVAAERQHYHELFDLATVFLSTALPAAARRDGVELGDGNPAGRPSPFPC